ncbi:hypothetical protein P171DRAFT_437249 [Karstenula rhodostoma CBS 690.94]|uniref:Uncharacterized protein n=1 Tax=Karstenula rhodostoma CBS 690.94 TaxID=1392251 RepID=A0A9P4P6L0_9PLEO|nr:hypothetical protein P171DRAFT_437249 [Karstenula rhodostoma CBS 690.94]
MQIAGDNAALPSDALYIPPATFTPINRPGVQLLAPQCSSGSNQTSQTRAANGAKRQHHPLIAQYLGLGKDKEPSHMQKLVPALPATPTTPPTNRKRGRKLREGKSPSRTTRSVQPRSSKQRRISDANVGFRVTKAASSGTRKDMTASTVSLTATKNSSDTPIETNDHAEDVRRSFRGANATAKRPTELSSFRNTTTLTQAFASLANSSPKSSETLVGSNAHCEPLCSEDQSQHTIADEFFDDVFDSMDLDRTFPQTAPDTHLPDAQNVADSSATICANDVALLSTPDLTDNCSSPLQPNRILNGHESEPTASGSVAHGSLKSGNVLGPSSKFKSPVTRTTGAFIWEEAQSVSHATDRKPIVRPVFPDAVRDRSPIVGLSSKSMLRSCFRVGEAISQAGKATKQGHSILFELYARVLSSERDAAKQHFLFSDLFHHRPPYLKGEYDAAIWKNVELFNYDSGRFLPESKMCRCIGRIRRNEKDQTWVMVVLNIWEATWEDIDWVEGIVNS